MLLFLNMIGPGIGKPDMVAGRQEQIPALATWVHRSDDIDRRTDAANSEPARACNILGNGEKNVQILGLF